jgi:peptide/nickel transport system substrate-binding protein
VKSLGLSLAVIMISILMLTGCNQNPGLATSTTAPATSSITSTKPSNTTTISTISTSPTSAPQSGGTLKFFIGGNPHSGYPPTMTGSDSSNFQTCVESLFIVDDKANLVPLLATGYKADAAAKTLTISLRQGVKFHDGTTFNATACKWNLDQFRSSARSELKLVNSVDIIDDYTIRLNLTKFDNTIIQQLVLDPGRMISPTTFQTNGQTWAENNPVGTGPFKFQKWTPDVSITFVRFDNYWGGKPNLDGLSVVMYADTTVALMDFKAGNLDIYSLITPSDTNDLKKAGFNIASSGGSLMMLVGYTKDPQSPFNDLKVRQAMSYAIDSKTISDNIGLGYWSMTNQFAIPGTTYYNPNVVGYPYNPQKAKDLLAQAGYASGLNATLNFFNNPIWMNECTAIQSYLNEVSIKTTLNPLQRPGFADMMSNGKGWSGILRTQDLVSTSDPLVITSKMTGGVEAAGMLLPQEYLDAYNAAITAVDDATKQKLVWQMASIAIDKYCMTTPVNVQPVNYVKTKKLHDDLLGVYPNQYISPKAWLSK